MPRFSSTIPGFISYVMLSLKDEVGKQVAME